MTCRRLLRQLPPWALGEAQTISWQRGQKAYELSNHLGNVLVTVRDKKKQYDSDSDGDVDWNEADVASAQDYYPFGMQMPGRQYTNGTGYRYGFNGKENDNDVKGDGNQQDYGMRIYDPRIGKFLSVDPLTKSFPFYSPYQFAGNKPISNIDLDCEEDYHYTYKRVRENNGWTVFTVKYDTELNTDGLSTFFRFGMDDNTYHLRPEGTNINNGIHFDSYSEMFAAAKLFATGDVDFNTSKKAQNENDWNNFLKIAAVDLAMQGQTAVEGYVTNKIAAKSVSAPIIAKTTQSAKSNTAKVYRTQGGQLPNASKERIIVGAKGNVSINGDEMLYVTLNDKNHQIYFYGKRGGSDKGASISSFEIPQSLANEIKNNAVPQAQGPMFPNRPQISDPTKSNSAYGLPKNYIDKLRQQIVQGSGKVESPKK